MNQLCVRHSTEEHQAVVHRFGLVLGVITMFSTLEAVILLKGLAGEANSLPIIGSLIFGAVVIGCLTGTPTSAVAIHLLSRGKPAALAVGGTFLLSYIAVFLLVSLSLGQFLMDLRDVWYMSVPAVVAYVAVRKFEKDLRRKKTS